MNITSRRFSRGDVREDGKIFWCYQTDKKTGTHTREFWISVDEIPFQYCRIVAHSAKARARISWLPFDIDANYLLELLPSDMKCPILRTNMLFYGGHKNHRPSLDKVKPQLGYVRGNVAWLSLEANRIKDNASLETVRRLLAYIERHS